MYANVGPVKTLLPCGCYDELIRANLECLYVGFEHYTRVGDELGARC